MKAALIRDDNRHFARAKVIVLYAIIYNEDPGLIALSQLRLSFAAQMELWSSGLGELFEQSILPSHKSRLLCRARLMPA